MNLKLSGHAMPVCEYRKLTLGHLLKDIFYTSLCSLVIALMLILTTSAQMTLKTYGEYFLIAQFIGLSIAIPCSLAFHFFKPVKTFFQVVIVILCVLGGVLLGSFLATRLDLHKFSGVSGRIPAEMLIVAVIIGFVISFGFILYEKYISFKLSANEEKLRRIVLEKEKLNADLKLLQAQMEPHFLFNTLSNILSLLEHDPKSGRQMLENLTQYLRTSLIQSRKPANRLADEIGMIRTYLDIYKIRMGKRLAYELDIPENVRDIQIPPMILQPLVENAIKHGLEPKIEGGAIKIRASRTESMLTLEVSDTGMGIKEKSATGVGTGNIRKRLAFLFDGRASLNFEDLAPSGLKAIVEIPCEADHSPHRR
ncbi:MAG: histidine kinase [Pseudomonadota bacterium]